jgi:hypothetical protein
MVLSTRSGTIGVALSTNHPSFNFDEYSYVASGFVITAKVKILEPFCVRRANRILSLSTCIDNSARIGRWCIGMAATVVKRVLRMIGTC